MPSIGPAGGGSWVCCTDDFSPELRAFTTHKEALAPVRSGALVTRFMGASLPDRVSEVVF